MKTCISSTVALLLVAVAAGCETTPPPAAQPAPLERLSKSEPVYKYVEAMRADLSRGKVAIFTDVMQLSATESKVFWPIYQDYEAELFDLGDQRLELIRRFANAQGGNALRDKEAAELSDGYFRFESARLELVKKYNGIIAKQLSPLHAAQFTQIEHRMGTVIDLLIAAELPLVQRGVATGG